MDVNEAYELWRDSQGQAKADAQEALFKAVKQYAERLIYTRKGEVPLYFGDDVAREVILDAEKFRGRAKFSTWVGKIIHNQWVDYIDDITNQREKTIESFHRPDGGESAEEAWNPGIDELQSMDGSWRQILGRVELAEAESHIPPQFERLYDTVFLQGKTHAEAAEELGKSPGAVESDVRRFRTSLRRKLRKLR